MSRYFNSFMDNSSEDLEHSWGTSPRAKAREKEYNHWYYQKHKDEIAAVRKQRSAATNSYKQAQKYRNDALTLKSYSDVADAILDASSGYPGLLNGLDANSLENDNHKYRILSEQSAAKSRELRIQGARQKYSAKIEAKRILQGLKNPKVRDLVEFYLDTTVEKAKKSASKAAKKAKKYTAKAMSSAEKAANKAKKYATKAMPMAEKAANKVEKYATKAMSSAEKAAKKYATKAMPMAEKAAKKAEKYATKTVKSVANKAKKYVVR